jgi:hypothetical protein
LIKLIIFFLIDIGIMAELLEDISQAMEMRVVRKRRPVLHSAILACQLAPLAKC